VLLRWRQLSALAAHAEAGGSISQFFIAGNFDVQNTAVLLSNSDVPVYSQPYFVPLPQ
jgi:hypothetical protein